MFRHGLGQSIWIAALLIAAASGPAAAEVIERSGTFGGLRVSYKVILPNGYDPARAYPAILHFAGGPQTMDIVERSIEADWRANAEQRGYIVVSPAAPNGQLFFQGGDRIFPEFIEHILREYRVQGGKLHVTGHSNGGLSAFHVAARFPQHFLSITGYPGLLNSPSEARLQAIKPLCIYMHVGDQDGGWLEAMRDQAQRLQREGYRVRFQVEENQVHRLDTRRANLANRLIEQIEAAGRGCAGGAS